jgi:hypothetical protein
MNPDLLVILLGAAGSIGIDLLQISRSYDRGRFAKKYRSTGFYTTQLLLAGIAGVVAWAHLAPDNLTKYWLAIHIGAATPLILKTFASRVPDDGGG